jgi:succinate dehydrogenase / fumarate reductase membrane anchor subunit
VKNAYVYKWIVQRITAIFLIPLSFWFIYHCISFQKLQYFELQLFFRSYTNSFFFVVMMFSMLIHAKLGCETIVQDYFSSTSVRKIFKIIINFITLSSLFFVIVAIIKLSVL